MTTTLPDWLEPIRRVIDQVDSSHLSPLLPPPPADARPAAVLLAFGEGDRGPDLLLTRRSTKMRAHPGQISFPGGSVDAEDPDAVAAALREAEEEIGLEADHVEVFGTLPRLWLPPSNFAVTPVVAHWHTATPVHVAEPREVAEVFRYPIADLLDPAKRFTTVHPLGWRGPGFDVGRDVPLWGFTAGVIARLFAVAGLERPWDESVERLVPGAR